MRGKAPSRRARCATPVSSFFRPSAKPLVPALDWASRRWLGRSRSPYVAEIARIADALEFLRHLAAQCLVSVGLHRPRRRAGWRAVAFAHAGLAVQRSRPPHRRGAHARRRRRRFLQRDLAGLCRRADRDGAGPLCRQHQPGADVAPHAASLAASVRFRGERAEGLAAHRSHAAGPIAAPDFRDLRGLSPRRGACWKRRRWRGR